MGCIAFLLRRARAKSLGCVMHQPVQVVSAALDMLSELPEYAPEQLLLSLQPHMMAMAQSACQAAARAGPVDLMHAAAWVKAFAAYVAEVPQELLQSQDAAHGVSLSDALLQVIDHPFAEASCASLSTIAIASTAATQA